MMIKKKYLISLSSLISLLLIVFTFNILDVQATENTHKITVTTYDDVVDGELVSCKSSCSVAINEPSSLYGNTNSLQAEANEDYNFAVFMEDDYVVSVNSKYNFRTTDDHKFSAIFTHKTKSTILIVDANNQYLGVLLVDKNENVNIVDIERFENKLIANPNYTFMGWSIDEDFVATKNLYVIKAIYETEAITYKVSVTDGEAIKHNVSHGKTFTVTDKNDGFSHWLINGVIASYNNKHTFSVYENINVEAVYGSDKKPQHISYLNEHIIKDGLNYYFMGQSYIKDDSNYSILEHGFLFLKSEEKITDEINLSTTNVERIRSIRTSPNNEFATLLTDVEAKYLYVRSYLVVDNGVTETIYSDTQLVEQFKYDIDYSLDKGINHKENKLVLNLKQLIEGFKLNTPTKEGYAFKGWFVNDEQVTKITLENVNDAFTAHWEINSYKITYKITDKDDVFRTYDYGAIIDTYEPKVKDGYEFSGWNPKVPTTMPANNLVVEGSFTKKVYTITFDSNGGSIVEPLQLKYGEIITEPSKPTKEGYDFVEWQLNGNTYNFTSKVTKEITLKAKWQKKPITYSITMDNKQYTRETLAAEFLADFYTFVNPKENLHDFLHGKNNSGGFNGTWYHTHKSKLYAKSSKDIIADAEYFFNDIRFNEKWMPLADMMEVFVKDVNSGQGFWSDPSTGQMRLWQYLRNVKPASNVKEETMNMMPTFVNETFEHTSGEAFVLPESPAARPGLTFVGWYLESDFSGEKVTEISALHKDDITVYAKWSPNSYAIIYNLDGGTLVDPIETIEFSTEELLLPVPTKEGYDFAGWYLNSDLTGDPITSLPQGSTRDAVVYASWISAAIYEIRYKYNDGSLDYDTKDEMIADFINDLTTYSGRAGITKENFFGTAVGNAETMLYSIFTHEDYTEKWLWLRDYIVQVAIDSNYSNISGLQNGTSNVWRSNLHAFFNDMNRSDWPASMNFSIYERAYNFWQKHEGARTYTEGEVSGELGILDRPEMIFLGWYLNSDFSGKPITTIPIDITGSITVYAKWIKESDYYKINLELHERIYSSNDIEDNPLKGKNELSLEFLTDFYNFLDISDVDLNTFMHGKGRTSGFDGLWHTDKYILKLYNNNDRTINAAKDKFINQPQYNKKWLPFFDMLEKFTNKVNNEQSFWGSIAFVGKHRIRQWVMHEKPAPNVTSELMKLMPKFLPRTETVITLSNYVLEKPTRDGYAFKGWYTSEDYSGVQVTEIDAKTRGKVVLYAKWEVLT